MGLPKESQTLSAEQVEELNKKLSEMRHDINNSLSLIIAATELIRRKPEAADRMITTIGDQPPKIMALVRKFSDEFERTLTITRDQF